MSPPHVSERHRLGRSRLVTAVLLLSLIFCCEAQPSTAQKDPLNASPSSGASPVQTLHAHIHALRVAAQEATAKQQWDAALNAWNQVLAIQPDDADALLGKSTILFSGMGRKTEAVGPLTTLTRLVPGNPTAWFQLCWALIDTHAFEAATAPCERAARLAPTNGGAIVNLGHARLLNGNPAEATRLYKRAVELIMDEESMRNGPISDFDLFIQRGWHVDEALAEKASMLAAWKDPSEVSNRADRKKIATLLEQAGRQAEMQGYESALPAIASARELATRRTELLPEVNHMAMLVEALAAMNKGRPAESLGKLQLARELVIARRGELHPDLVLLDKVRATVFLFSKQIDKAEEAAQRGLVISKATTGEFSRPTADMLNILSRIYQLDGKPQRRIEAMRRHYEVTENIAGPESPSTLNALRELVTALIHAGHSGEALSLLPRVIALSQSSFGPDSEKAINAITVLAGLYRDIDRYDEAIPLLLDALARSERSLGKDSRQTGYVLYGLGRLYVAMGQPDQALPLLERARLIEKSNPWNFSGVPEGALKEEALQLEVAGDLSLAGIYRMVGKHEDALRIIDATLPSIEKFLGKTHHQSLLTRTKRAGIELEMHHDQAALDQLTALRSQIQTAGQVPDEVVSELLGSLQVAHFRLGHAEAIMPIAMQRLALMQRSGHSPLELAQQRLFMAFVLESQGKRDLAIFHGKVAVNSIQSLRTRYTQLDPNLQQGFLQKNQQGYQLLASWLIDAGRLGEAQQVTAMLKEQELFDLVRRDASSDPRTSQASLSGFELPFEQRYEDIAARMMNAARGLVELERKARSQPLDSAELDRRQTLQAQQTAGQLAFERYLTELESSFARLSEQRKKEIAELNLGKAEALQSTLEKLGHGAVLLHYVVLDDQLKVILTTSKLQRAYTVKVSQAELNRAIHTLRQGIEERSDVKAAARQLHGWLIAPLQADLQSAEARTLMVALTGSLRYLPFSALHDGQQWLAERYALALYTEAARDRIRDQPIAQWRLQAFGLTRSVKGFKPLPGVRAELDAIVGPEGLPGSKQLDEQFTIGSFETAVADRPPVLHVASHFVFKPGTEVDSYLVLGDGQRLSLASLKTYRFRDLDLLTLSACETALGGGQNENGREIEGFGALAQTRGASSVIATLWPVADHSTAQFMQLFYRSRAVGSLLTKAQALQQAQVALINGRMDPAPLASPSSIASASGERQASRPTPSGATAQAPVDPARPYSHPYFWAPFLLMGNWL